MATIEGQRNLIQIGIDTVTKTAVRFESVRPKRLRVESFAMSKAFEYGLYVPKVRQYGLNEQNQEFIVMDKLEGQSAADDNLRVPLERVYRLVGEQFSRVPADQTSFGWISPDSPVGTSPSWLEFLADYTQKYVGRLYDKHRIDKKTAEEIYKLVDTRTPLVSSASLIHRDLKPLNLLVGKRVGILDWENAMFGDPLFDLGVLFSRFPDDERMIKGFMRGLLGGLPNDDQKDAVTLYSLINLVGAICFYKDQVSPSLFQRLEDTIKEMNSPSGENRIFSSKRIHKPFPLPSYHRNQF